MQAEENGAEAVFEHGRNLKELIGRLRGVFFQAFAVGDDLWRFEGEAETGRNLGGPGGEVGGAGHLVEGAVDFDGGEVLGVVAQHLFLWQLRWIETAFPFGFAEGTGADEEFHD